jgi:molecular chaperone HscB
VIHVPAPDPFTVFGLSRSLDLDERQLETRYLRLSRVCHPDLHRANDTGDCIAVLQRSAEINDAWKVLRDPWQRARALLELLSPGVLERNKRLDPGFLGEALELAEEVAGAQGARIAPLRTRLEADHDAAARRLHMSHYHKKALQDLDAKS